MISWASAGDDAKPHLVPGLRSNVIRVCNVQTLVFSDELENKPFPRTHIEFILDYFRRIACASFASVACMAFASGGGHSFGAAIVHSFLFYFKKQVKGRKGYGRGHGRYFTIKPNESER